MKRAFIFAGLAALVFLGFFAPTFILVARGLANTTLVSSVDISALTTSPVPSPAVPPVTAPLARASTTPALKASTTASVSSPSAPGSSTPPAPTARFTTISVNGQSFKAEISDTPALQELGLSYRPSLPPNQVMLFVFQEASNWGIWMKGMNFPLDILWLDASGNVIDAEPNVAVSTYPNILTPPSPALYVIEANVGWIAANNVSVGTHIAIQ